MSTLRAKPYLSVQAAITAVRLWDAYSVLSAERVSARECKRESRNLISTMLAIRLTMHSPKICPQYLLQLCFVTKFVIRGDAADSGDQFPVDVCV